MRSPLVLASASPRRRELLARLSLSFEVEASSTDESVAPGEPAEVYVRRVAQEKARVVTQRRPQALVLAADTTVVLGTEILGKPESADEARRMLERLSGASHRVLTAVVLDGAARGSVVVETAVDFRPLNAQEIAWYVGTGEPMDKAGSYALQGAGGAFVRAIRGSHSNVVGLPLVETLELLAAHGWTPPWGAP
jgi:septum formation protein